MKTLRFAGILLIVLSGIGFLTVADDLRHVGELVGVGAIGIVGVIVATVAHLFLRKRSSDSDGSD
jgi:FtsH-binding integral membrane protein